MEASPVLVIDDDPDSLVVMQTLLKEVLGVASVGARDAAEAFAIIDRITPSLILLDVRMPGPTSSYDGLMVARRVKGDFATRRVPVVAVSGLSNGKEIARKVGCEDFIEKPFEIDAFVRVVRKHLPRSVAG